MLGGEVIIHRLLFVIWVISLMSSWNREFPLYIELILGGWDREFSLYIFVSGGWDREFSLYIELSSFQGVGIESFHCI